MTANKSLEEPIGGKLRLMEASVRSQPTVEVVPCCPRILPPTAQLSVR